MRGIDHVITKTVERYETARASAWEKDRERDYLQAFYCHAAAEAFADVMTDASSITTAERDTWRARASYHNRSCQNLRKWLAQVDLYRSRAAP
jgi:hypothetical protein